MLFHSSEFMVDWRGLAKTGVTMKDVIALLQTERAELLDRVAKVDAAITALGGKPGGTRSSTQPAKPPRKRRNMSEQARKATSERMKKYWEERRKQSAATESGESAGGESGASGG